MIWNRSGLVYQVCGPVKAHSSSPKYLKPAASVGGRVSQCDLRNTIFGLKAKDFNMSSHWLSAFITQCIRLSHLIIVTTNQNSFPTQWNIAALFFVNLGLWCFTLCCLYLLLHCIWSFWCGPVWHMKVLFHDRCTDDKKVCW